LANCRRLQEGFGEGTVANAEVTQSRFEEEEKKKVKRKFSHEDTIGGEACSNLDFEGGSGDIANPEGEQDRKGFTRKGTNFDKTKGRGVQYLSTVAQKVRRKREIGGRERQMTRMKDSL